VVREGGELVLRFAGDCPFLGRDCLMFTHREAGTGFGVLGNRRHQLPRAQSGKRLQPSPQILGPVGVEQHRAQILVDGDRRVGRGVHTSRDTRVDLAEGDLVGDHDRGLEAGATGLLHVVRGSLG